MKPEIAIAHYILGKLSGEDIVNLADSWLNDGIFLEPLNYILSETHPQMADVGPLFERAIRELGIEFPNKVDAARIATADTIRQMVSGEIDLMAGAEFLYWDIQNQVTNDLPDGKYLGSNLGLEHIFCWLREIWDCRDGAKILNYSDLPREQAD